MTLQWPVFHLSANLIATHHLKPRRESLPGRVGGGIKPLLASWTGQTGPPPPFSEVNLPLAGVHANMGPFWLMATRSSSREALRKTSCIMNCFPRIFQPIGRWSR